MRTKEERVSDRRLCAVTLSVFAVFILALFTGCAPVTHDPLYDGGIIMPDEGDSVTLIPLHIENHRTVDAVDPRFFLVGTGSHSLGIVLGINGKLDRLIDRNWLRPDGCAVIVAHYAGDGDLVFDRLCWRKGERIEVSLDNIFVPGAAWSHR